MRLGFEYTGVSESSECAGGLGEVDRAYRWRFVSFQVDKLLPIGVWEVGRGSGVVASFSAGMGKREIDARVVFEANVQKTSDGRTERNFEAGKQCLPI